MPVPALVTRTYPGEAGIERLTGDERSERRDQRDVLRTYGGEMLRKQGHARLAALGTVFSGQPLL